MKYPKINFDCKHFKGDSPCFAHKQHGLSCAKCQYYRKRRSVNFIVLRKGENKAKQHNDLSVKKIIIVKLAAKGDVLRTTSILPSLKDKYPNSRISWITKPNSVSLLKNNEMIRDILPDEKMLIKQFRNYKFDIAINLDNTRESCAIMNLIFAKQKFGFHLLQDTPFPVNELAFEWYLMAINDHFKKANKKTYHRLIHEICNLKYKHSKPVLKMNKQRLKIASRIKNKFGLERFKDFILINLGGGSRWQHKKWTKEGYSELIDLLAASKPKSCIGIIAGREDKDFYGEVLKRVKKLKNIIFLGCDNSLDEFISIIYLAGKLFTSDSLALHIANALKTYVVCIVGPTSHTELDVFGKGKIIYSNKVGCLCCYKEKCDKKMNCMNTVLVNEIAKYLA